MQKDGDIYLEYSRIQMIRISISEKNGLKAIQFSSNIMIENKMKIDIEISFRRAFELLVILFILFILIINFLKE